VRSEREAVCEAKTRRKNAELKTLVLSLHSDDAKLLRTDRCEGLRYGDEERGACSNNKSHECIYSTSFVSSTAAGTLFRSINRSNKSSVYFASLPALCNLLVGTCTSDSRQLRPPIPSIYLSHRLTSNASQHVSNLVCFLTPAHPEYNDCVSQMNTPALASLLLLNSSNMSRSNPRLERERRSARGSWKMRKRGCEEERVERVAWRRL
jgi:hypothetical protein